MCFDSPTNQPIIFLLPVARHIEAAIKRLEKTHLPFLGLCDPSGGVDNEQRLKGWFCTAPYRQFCWGVEDRNATIRIPRLVADAGKGFLEDRRPASNFDPYLVTGALVRIIVLGETTVYNPYLAAGAGAGGGGGGEKLGRRGSGGEKSEIEKVANSLQKMCSFN